MAEAIISGNGTFYADGVERLYVHINKSLCHGLLYKDGKQVPITINIGGEDFRGNLRSRSNFQYIYVAARLWDTNGKEHKQTYLLKDNGYSKGQGVKFLVSDGRVSILNDIKVR